LIAVGGLPAFVVGIPIPSIGIAYFEIHVLSELQGTLDTLADVLLATAAMTTAGGTVLGLWASRRLVRPLSATARVASEIAAGTLDRRVPANRDVGPLVESFNDMVDTLQQRIERDARFAADLSHELRSPLTTVSASVELVDSYRASLPGDGQTAVDLLRFEVGRLSDMVQDLLEISRMDARSASVTFTTLPIAELVSLTVAAHRVGVPMRVASRARDVQVKGDKRRLQRVIVNLLDNADVHAGGAVLVVIDVREASVEVVVEDAGPGVLPPDDQRIFERFYRGAAAGRRGTTAGTGLGLALVKEHVRAHRGSVHVESRPGGGSRFVVSLPMVEV
jgi:signal transduction histidine kinase